VHDVNRILYIFDTVLTVRHVLQSAETPCSVTGTMHVYTYVHWNSLECAGWVHEHSLDKGE